MNVLIIEDEALAAERLEKLLHEVAPGIRVMDKVASVNEAVKWLTVNTADLLFVDIQLSDGLSFSIFEELQVDTPVIFTTAYDQYALKAFKLNSIDYLLKPIRKKDLMESLGKLKRIRSAIGIDYDRLGQMIRGETPEYKQRFLVRYGDKLKKLEVREIAYFYAFEKAVFLRSFEKQSYAIDFSLDQLEESLNPDQFFRINRKYLVNMDSIEKMTAYSRGRIMLGLKPPPDVDLDPLVSVERSADFRNWIG